MFEHLENITGNVLIKHIIETLTPQKISQRKEDINVDNDYIK